MANVDTGLFHIAHIWPKRTAMVKVPGATLKLGNKIICWMPVCWYDEQSEQKSIFDISSLCRLVQPGFVWPSCLPVFNFSACKGKLEEQYQFMAEW